MHRGRPIVLATASRAWRLGVHAHHVVTGIDQRTQSRNREIGTAKKGDAQRSDSQDSNFAHAACSRARCFFAFTIFFIMMLRFSAEM